jgi:hypothetical protein
VLGRWVLSAPAQECVLTQTSCPPPPAQELEFGPPLLESSDGSDDDCCGGTGAQRGRISELFDAPDVPGAEALLAGDTQVRARSAAWAGRRVAVLPHVAGSSLSLTPAARTLLQPRRFATAAVPGASPRSAAGGAPRQLVPEQSPGQAGTIPSAGAGPASPALGTPGGAPAAAGQEPATPTVRSRKLVRRHDGSWGAGVQGAGSYALASSPAAGAKQGTVSVKRQGVEGARSVAVSVDRLQVVPVHPAQQQQPAQHDSMVGRRVVAMYGKHAAMPGTITSVQPGLPKPFSAQMQSPPPSTAMRSANLKQDQLHLLSPAARRVAAELGKIANPPQQELRWPRSEVLARLQDWCMRNNVDLRLHEPSVSQLADYLEGRGWGSSTVLFSARLVCAYSGNSKAQVRRPPPAGAALLRALLHRLAAACGAPGPPARA